MSGPVRSGLDVLADSRSDLAEARAGLVLHPASVSADLTFSLERLSGAGFAIDALFGPQHGARGEKQDNMIESDFYTDPVSGLPVHSLYGEVRKPTPEMLDGLEVVLFDLQDVGVRVYTFVWTMALAMEACAEAGIPFVVLDRPNPVGGVTREGEVLKDGYDSFVGLHPIPLRHGLTAGELARWLNTERGIDCDLEVVPCEGWRRTMSWSETGLPWVQPSPNLPTPDSCDVYPGMVLLEGTNLSEGRGTTRPFELFGAPWIDPHEFAKEVAADLGPGVVLRPGWFEPTFQKHAGVICGGGQLHVTDREALRSVRTAVAILAACHRLAPDDFAWRDPPYEYEEVLLPIDILWGSDRLRTAIDSGASTDSIMAESESDLDDFSRSVGDYLLYD